MKLRVSIIEDDQPTRSILADLIRSAPQLELVSEYGDSEAAIKGLAAEKPDVVLADINMPKFSGIDCVRLLKPQMPATQFLMLTVYEDSDHIFAALSVGATGYLLKKTRRVELLAAIEQIMQGGSPMSSGIARKVVQSFTKSNAEGQGIDILSPREKAVLDLLTQGYLYKEIARSLGVSMPTVNTYIRRIYDKLQVDSRTRAVAKYLKKTN